jgi:hypothetical protein
MRSVPLEMVRGEDGIWSFTVKQSGLAFDITSATISFKAAYEYGATPEITCSVGDGITITSGSGGIFELHIAASKTAIASIPANQERVRMVYSLSVTKSSKTYYVANGELLIYGRVS